MAQETAVGNVTFEHIKSTDMLFVDIQQPDQGARITTVDVGERIGFPGQILARVDYDKEILYGLTIQNAKRFKRKLLWEYRMVSLKRAIAFLIAAISAGLLIEEHNPSRIHPAGA